MTLSNDISGNEISLGLEDIQRKRHHYPKPYFLRPKKAAQTNATASLPFLVWIVFIATGIAIIGGKGAFGFRISGLTWVFPLFFAVWIFIKQPGQIKLPIWIWLPWVLVLAGYFIFFAPSSFQRPVLQRTAQLLCPIVIGIVVSTCRVEVLQLRGFIILCKRFSVVLVIIALFKTGFLLTGQIPVTTGLAAEVMTGLLLCCLFAAGYAGGKKIDLYWWAFLAALPIYGLRRTPIAITLLTLPLTFESMNLKKRVLILVAILAVGLALFYSPRVQKAMFYSGTGTISDALAGNVADAGRYRMWEGLKRGIEQQPWFGHGTNSASAFVKVLTRGLEQPHNDWLGTMYDYGRFGTVIYTLCLIMALLHALHKAKAACCEEVRLLFLAGAASFVVFALLMVTDNIMIYASFFGNLQFTILGLAYAAATDKNNKKTKKIKFSWA